MQLHTRASWSSREDRRITLLWLGLFLAIVLVGFGTDLTKYLHETPHPPKIVHVHAIFTTIWLLVLTIQVLLVEVDNVKLHRKFGWFAAGWATLLVFIAAWGELSWEATNLHTPGTTPAFIAIPVGNLLSFSALITWGILLRKNLAAHRRVIFLANISIMTAGAARLFENVFHFSFSTPVQAFFFFYSGSLVLLLLMFLWDWKKNRVMRQFLIGSAYIITLQVISIVLFFNPSWTNFARGVIEAWGKFAL